MNYQTVPRDLKASSQACSAIVTTKWRPDINQQVVAKGAVRNYQGGRVANNRGRVMIFCALKRGGLQFFQLSLRGGS